MTDKYCINCKHYMQYKAIVFIGPVIGRECWHQNNTKMDEVEGKRMTLRHIEDARKHYCKGEWFEDEEKER